MTMNQKAIAEYARDLGISLKEARAQWTQMQKETEEYARAKGIPFDEAEAILVRKELEESGAIFEMAQLVEKHAGLFSPNTVEQAKKIRKKRQ